MKDNCLENKQPKKWSEPNIKEREKIIKK
jgi:hypothetical protein